jgi:hypothetical protein
MVSDHITTLRHNPDNDLDTFMCVANIPDWSVQMTAAQECSFT